MYQENITSLAAILSTIKTDAQVYRWFAYLIIHPEVQAKMRQDKRVSTEYDTFKKCVKNQEILYGAFFVGLLIVLFLQQYIYLYGMLLFLYPYFQLNLKKKKIVVDISAHLISLDFEENILQKKTLYQIGENYSRQYHIPSLVDTIYHLDNISRHTIIIIYVAIGLIWSLNTFIILLILTIAYYLVNTLVKTDKIYQSLR